jgi:hypothetical protein
MDCFEITIPGLRRNPVYIYKRKSDKCVCRIEVVYVTAGDIYYLYLILKQRPIVSFEDALTVSNVLYASFQQSAVAAGYVTDRKEAIECYRNVAENTLTPYGDVHLTPANLRALFCHLTIEGYPTREIYDTPDLLRYMLTDYLDDGMTTPQVSFLYTCNMYYIYVYYIYAYYIYYIYAYYIYAYYIYVSNIPIYIFYYLRQPTSGSLIFKIDFNETIKQWSNMAFPHH